MTPRPAADIAADWRTLSPHAVIVASPSAARTLAGAIGADALRSLRAVVAIGETTRTTLAALGIPVTVPPDTNFSAAARHLAALRSAAAPVTG
jgi:uroporphyrinogen-III synthase